MKITVTKEETIEKDAPFFTKDGNSYYAFYSDEIKITVQDFYSPLITGLIASQSTVAFYPEITAKEFEDAYIRVSERLNDLFEQGRDKVRESKGLTTDNFQVTE